MNTGGTKQRVVEHLQTVSSATAPELARLMGVTDAAMRQHLEQLELDGVVRRLATDSPTDVRHRGRPAVHWALDLRDSQTAIDGFPTAFPDRHDELVVDLVRAIRDELGIVGSGTLLERVERLARQRDVEGYRADATSADDGSVTLTEHHCAIADAARSCGNLCESELVVFRRVLGPHASVERTQHAMSGDGRCSYRITDVR
ncbi:MAG: hypothetical protein EBX95_00590 [Acidimicrobiia bacterium]|nr:hypothetical protein [Acidimicrobiia bacterium]